MNDRPDTRAQGRGRCDRGGQAQAARHDWLDAQAVCEEFQRILHAPCMPLDLEPFFTSVVEARRHLVGFSAGATYKLTVGSVKKADLAMETGAELDDIDAD